MAEEQCLQPSFEGNQRCGYITKITDDERQWQQQTLSPFLVGLRVIFARSRYICRRVSRTCGSCAICIATMCRAPFSASSAVWNCLPHAYTHSLITSRLNAPFQHVINSEVEFLVFFSQHQYNTQITWGEIWHGRLSLALQCYISPWSVHGCKTGSENSFRKQILGTNSPFQDIQPKQLIWNTKLVKYDSICYIAWHTNTNISKEIQHWQDTIIRGQLTIALKPNPDAGHSKHNVIYYNNCFTAIIEANLH